LYEGGVCFSRSLPRGLIHFFLDEKVNKKSRNNDASTPKGKTPGPPFFHPHARIFCFIEYLFFFSENPKNY
jgi:hypothetical protein